MNNYIYKPCTHSCMLYFKFDTFVKPIEGLEIPFYGFNFTPYSAIFQQSREDEKLIDVIGVVVAKGELSNFYKGNKTVNYIVVDLDALDGSEILSCTLWEDFAQQFLQYVAEGHDGPIVLILQLAKLKLFKGKMGVSNANYNSKPLMNIDIPVVQDLKKSYLMKNPNRNSATITAASKYSLSNDVLNESVYKSIAELKNNNEDGYFVTYGIVKDIELRTNWTYRACPMRNCLAGVKEQDERYFCKKCNKGYHNATFRYNIQIVVADETDSTTFTVFDREASNFLKKSAVELHNSYAERANIDEMYPQELDLFKEKAFVFKVQVKTEFFNYTEQTNIQVNRLVTDDALIKSFLDKYKIEECPSQSGSYEILDDDHETNDTTKISNAPKQSEEDSSFVRTPPSTSKTIGVKAKATIDVCDDTQMSANKIPKVIKQEKED
ncbi:uncharacterized protein LOC130742876 [Lotus japonicus]|uniref:uncharacterized protein LOC130742876 n=1 Tax=Lotus japonicus TaxID=34305 RepID=UPI00258A2869|nr:uncharacterized protein LOC130742876 [Lotus japonicus]